MGTYQIARRAASSVRKIMWLFPSVCSAAVNHRPPETARPLRCSNHLRSESMHRSQAICIVGALGAVFVLRVTNWTLSSSGMFLI
ncbi:hypothetical protein P153DRAFT_199851 [Dothidotthia symphoricarpi CBS 119687]|uniref:Uncharacterized protein n=1 Tax=Dothidotthia symphoricarpi CBS 119687 TaxID=1392245 RepID=A0A6A6AK62_9PLEO|nr:uncharacterized protein P153DRAFT_199851 [Dothidotthia symphoricarpi CBS 119687]KAF2131623.1 hypothetical protein P153DRAFT_199851 [Dothidotthia symphoricarpi CBS 119687]